MNADKASYEGPLPNRQPQAPRSIPVEQVDRNSRPLPYNKGGEAHGARATVAGEPAKQAN